MNGGIRFIASMLFAALVTVGLFLVMVFLISGEFEPREKKEQRDFDINPVIEDVETLRREIRIDRVKTVETPPPAPPISTQSASKPTVAIAKLEGAKIEFEAPKIDKDSFVIQESDRDAQPLVRIPPQSPPDAERSGHCDMTFDVSPDGSPFNINANCTERAFRRGSVKAVEKWKYQPKIRDGRAVGRSGVQTRLTYKVQDENGRVIPPR